MIQRLLQEIDAAINNFNEFVPQHQRDIFKSVQALLRDIEVSRSNVKNSVTNLRSINSFVTQFDNLISNKNYQRKVVDFTKAFDVVSSLQNQYFSSISADYTPSKVLAEIRKQSIESTINSLTESGISANVSEGVRGILRTSITTGGDISDLEDQMRNYILSNESGLGALERYTKQITTDALNQFTAQYSATVTADLGLEWFEYVGSLIATSRPFCVHLTKKRWIHISELDTILHDNIDGVKICSKEIPCNKKTGLPQGMIPGTNPDNLSVNRGGYECGHQLIPVSKEMVPANIRFKFENDTLPSDESARAAKVDMKQIKKYPTKFDESVIDMLSRPLNINLDAGGSVSHYEYTSNTLSIVRHTAWQKSKYKQEHVIYHEFGHATHAQRNIITLTHVDPKFKKLYEDARTLVIGNADKMDDKLRNLFFSDDHKKYGFEHQADFKEAVMGVADTLSALTMGRFGAGHDWEYWRTRPNAPYAELFAHASEIYFGNSVMFDEVMKDVKELLNEYFRNEIIENSI